MGNMYNEISLFMMPKEIQYEFHCSVNDSWTGLTSKGSVAEDLDHFAG